jgi:hypothetical protein
MGQERRASISDSIGDSHGIKHTTNPVHSRQQKEVARQKAEGKAAHTRDDCASRRAVQSARKIGYFRDLTPCSEETCGGGITSLIYRVFFVHQDRPGYFASNILQK